MLRNEPVVVVETNFKRGILIPAPLDLGCQILNHRQDFDISRSHDLDDVVKRQPVALLLVKVLGVDDVGESGAIQNELHQRVDPALDVDVNVGGDESLGDLWRDNANGGVRHVGVGPKEGDHNRRHQSRKNRT